METGLKKEQLNSKFFKKELGKDLLHKNYLAVVTEGWNSSDVFGVRRSLYTVEIEIKVSKSDLKGELISVDLCKNGGAGYGYAGPEPHKYTKHFDYLVNKPAERYHQMPNEFYFAVPDFLEKEALAGVEGTPYGVITLGNYLYVGTNYKGETFTNKLWGIHYAKRAEKLHGKKLFPESLNILLNKLTWENFNLRDRLEERV